MKSAPIAPDYSAFLTEVKGRIQSARLSAGRAVNRELVLLYWDIGRGIVEKQQSLGWGDAVVESLARDLGEAFPGMRGFSASNLWRMRQFFAALTAPDFLAQLVRELVSKAQEPEILAQAVRELAGAIPWGQHVEMLNKLSDPAVVGPRSTLCFPVLFCFRLPHRTMKTEIHAELPQELIDEARVFVAQGLAADLDHLVADALRRYLDSHSARLTEAFGREDVEWGLHGRE